MESLYGTIWMIKARIRKQWSYCTTYFEIPTLLVPHIWFSRRTSIQVRSVIRDWLILPVQNVINRLKMWWWERFLWFKDKRHWVNSPASRRRLPSALVLLVRSLPARSTRHSWLTFTWFLSWNLTQSLNEKRLESHLTWARFNKLAK